MKMSKKYLVWTIIVCVLAVAINAYIIMHSCLNGTNSSKASQGIVDISENVVNTISPGTVNESNYAAFATFIRKAFGHFGLFMVSGLLSSLAVYLAFKPLKWSKPFIIVIIGISFGILLAVITEVIQLNVPGRSGQFTDVLIDSGGYLLGLLIIALIVFLVVKSQRKKTPELHSN